MSEPSLQQQAFERYVVPEMEVMLRVALSLTRHTADAEDLVQDSLVRAFRAIDRFDGRYPRAWLLTIVRNTYLNRVRKKVPELLHDADDAQQILDRPTVVDSPETVVIDAGFDASVHAAFESLSDRFRTVVELVDLGGLSYQEAAGVLGVPVGTVMSRLHRARKKIRTQLDRTAPEPGRAP